ncbi:MAG: DpnII family type II restriction endonuclease, partial [archaeon]
FLIETNFFNGGGSKLKSVCGEFKSLFNELKQQEIELIWVTDGKGWETTKRPLEESFNNNNYIFNLNQLENDILKEALTD